MERLNDIANEGVVIGFLFKNPILFEKYSELIIAEYDFDSQDTRFMYEVLLSTFLKHGKLNETSIKLHILELSGFEKKKWDDKKYMAVLKKLAKVSDSIDNFENSYNKLKTYNVLRYLHKKGFNVIDDIDDLKSKSSLEIIQIFETKLVKASSHIKNINDSIVLGEDIVETYNRLKEKPAVGLKIPFPIVNSITRGWRLNTIFATAMHSGFGKSRFIIYILCKLAIIRSIPILLCVNEQDKAEIELMVLTCIANMLYSKKYGITINETDIALGVLKDDADRMIVDAANFIKDNSRLHFLEMQSWDLESIKMILKRHKLKGIDYVVIDTFKAMRGMDTKMSDWMQFVYTAEQLKAIIGSEKKGGLNMGLWITLQMTDDSQITNIMNSTSIATGKQIKHNLDFLILFRMLTQKEKSEYSVLINMPNNQFNGQIQPLNKSDTYYISAVDKNRGGRDKQRIIYTVDKGLMSFKEIGYAVSD